MAKAKTAEPLRFQTREQLTEWFDVQFAVLERSPDPAAKSQKHFELMLKRDEALIALGRDIGALDLALTPVTPPRPEPEPLPDDATDEEKAEALYGNPVPIGVGGVGRYFGRRPEPDPPPTPGDDAP